MDVPMRDPIQIANEYKAGTKRTDPEWDAWYMEKGVKLEDEFLGHLLLRGDFTFTEVQRLQMLNLIGEFERYLISGRIDGDDYYDLFMDLMYMFANIED
jgi:hypothetical protein